MTKRVLTIALTVGLTSASCLISGKNFAQQDIHVSNFFASQNWLNPGAAGFFQGDMRFFADYRSQWTKISPNAFKTLSFSLDGRMLEENLNNGFIGAALNFYNDVTGDGIMKTNNVSANINYGLELDRYNKLALGLNIGLLNRSVSFADFYWNNQWNGEQYDTSTPSGETGLNANFSAVDLGAGLYYFGTPSDDVRIYGGVGAWHLNRPNVSLYGGEDKLYMKFNIHGGVNYNLPLKRTAFMPNFMYMIQGPNRVLNVGTDVKYLLKERSHYTAYYDETSIAFGAYYRAGDALFGTVRFSMAGFTVGAAYDFTLSDLNKANNGFGALEFMFMYRASFGKSGWGAASF